MNRYAKRILFPFITVLLSLMLAIFPSFHAENIMEGYLGTDASYIISEDGELTISGTGILPDVSPENLPFGVYATAVTALTINDGITEIGDFFFLGLNITSVTVPSSVTSIGDCAFGYLYHDEAFTKMPYFVIYGSENSVAEQYATDNGFIFIATDSETPQGICGNGILWSLSADGVLTVSGTGEIGEASTDAPHSFAQYATEYNGRVIRSLVISEGITAIGNGAFSDLSSLTSISFPKSLKTIGNYAFANCTSLSSLEIPGNVTHIGRAAFSSCLSLSELTLKEGIKEIGPHAFELADITSLRLPSSLVTLGENAFFACESLKTANISVLSVIPTKAFAFCESLTDITFHSSLMAIGKSSFEGCSSLTSLSLPSTLVSIDDRAFHSCSSLATLSLPNNLTQIGTYTFRNCTALKTLTIGSNTLTIPEGTFYGCTSLSSVTLGASVETIGDYAFANCPSLTSLLVPSRVKTIGAYAIGYVEDEAENLVVPTTPIVIEGYQPSIAQNYASDNGLTFSSLGNTHNDGGVLTSSATWSIDIAKGLLKITGFGRVPDYPSFESTPWAIYKNEIRSVFVESGIENVGASSFEGCTNLVNLSLPSSVTFIGSYAFAETAIVTLTLPEGLREIDTAAFEACPSLHVINLPSSLETIGQCAFRGPNTAPSIFVPSTVTYIGTYAIGFNGDNSPAQGFVIKGARGSVAEHYATEAGLEFIENGYINIDDASGTGSYLSIPGTSASGLVFRYQIDGFTLSPSVLLPNSSAVYLCTLKLTIDEYTRNPEGVCSIYLSLPDEILAKGENVIKKLRVYAMSPEGLFTEVSLLETPSADSLLAFTHTSLGSFVITDADLTKLVTLTVQYKHSDGTTLSDNYVVRAAIGATYSFEAPKIADLSVDSSRLEGKATSDLTLTFTYSPQGPGTTPETTLPLTSPDDDSDTGARFLLIILLILLFVALIAAVLLLIYLNKKKKKEALETQKTMYAARKHRGPDNKFAQTIVVPEFKTQELDIQSLFADEPEEDTEAIEKLKRTQPNSRRNGKKPPQNR